jgi:3-hydroxyisobutyrate dehydrogenase
MSDTHIGFIGLGNIGKPMATNLAQSDFNTIVYDAFPAASKSFTKHGTPVAQSPAEMAESCSIIGVCVRDDADVEDVVLGSNGLLSTAKSGTIIAIHSTVQQNTILDLAKKTAAKGVHLIDAAITGGASGAKDKKLCYMVGGPSELLARCRPVFNTSAESIVHAGELGSGIALKLCNNLMTYAAFIAVHEGAKLAEASGLSLEVLCEVGRSNGVVTPQMATFIVNRNKVFQSCSKEDYRSIFSGYAALGIKDLKAALDSAAKLGITLPATEKNATVIESVFFNET